MTTVVQENLALLERFSEFVPNDIYRAKDLLSNRFVWHYFNPELPEIQGDYVGLNGLHDFFQKLGALTQQTFNVEIKQVIPLGDELVVVHANPTMVFDDHPIDLDAVVVWRIVNNQIAEVWDIPAINTERLHRLKTLA